MAKITNSVEKDSRYSPASHCKYSDHNFDNRTRKGLQAFFSHAHKDKSIYRKKKCTKFIVTLEKYKVHINRIKTHEHLIPRKKTNDHRIQQEDQYKQNNNKNKERQMAMPIYFGTAYLDPFLLFNWYCLIYKAVVL